MTATQDETALHVPARVVPVPTTVSAEAQAFLASGPLPSADYPAPDDADGWRAMIAITDEMVLKMFDDSGLSSPEGFEIDEIDAGGVPTYVITRSDPGALLLYAGGHDLTDPYVSPVFGDFSPGFPPTLLASGTRDLLLSDTVRLHRALRAAHVTAELHVFEAAPHGFFRGQAPEDRELDREVRDFIERVCPSRR